MMTDDYNIYDTRIEDSEVEKELEEEEDDDEEETLDSYGFTEEF